METNRNRQVTYQIHRHLGSLSVSKTGWSKEVNIVSWNDGRPRLDIREWDPEHEKMSRGVGLTGEETENLRALLKDLEPADLAI